MQTATKPKSISIPNTNSKKSDHFLKGLPLITYYSGLRKNDKAIQEEIRLSISKSESTRAYLYYPAGKNPKDLPGIFFPHGMNISGIDDIRMQNLSRNLALSGYSVITPHIPEVTALLINERVINDITYLFNDFFQKEEYHLKDRLSFFSVSFSGSIGMIAFSQDKVRDRILSAMVIGSCCDFAETFTYANESFSKDNYAGMLLLYNYLHYLDKKLHSEISKSLFEYAVDNSLRRRGDKSVGALEHSKLRPAASEFLNKIFEDKDFRNSIANAIKEKIPTSLIRTLSPFYHLSGLKAPLSLLHGATDPVISPNESRKIHEYLQNRNHPSHLEISDLITHGDQVPLYTQILGIPGVAKSFGYYFTHT